MYCLSEHSVNFLIYMLQCLVGIMPLKNIRVIKSSLKEPNDKFMCKTKDLRYIYNILNSKRSFNYCFHEVFIFLCSCFTLLHIARHFILR